MGATDIGLSNGLGFPTPEIMLEVLRTWEPDLGTSPLADLIPMADYPIDQIEWDIFGAIMGMIPQSTMGADPQPVQPVSLTTKSAKTTYWAGYRRLTQKEIQRVRRAGTINQLAGEQLAMEALRQLNVMIDTRVEWLKWQMILGAITLNEDGITRTIDYGIPNTHVITPDVSWDTVATATIVDNLQAATELFLGSSDGSPIMFINSVDVKYLGRNAEIKDLLKQSPLVLSLGRDRIAQLFPQLVGDLQEIRVIKKGYKDTSGAYQSFLPDGKVVLLAPPPQGQDLGKFYTTPDVRNGGLNPRPGKFLVVEDELQSKNPRYDMTGGINGLPVLNFPECVAIIDIY
jgi:hypothetical protein